MPNTKNIWKKLIHQTYLLIIDLFVMNESVIYIKKKYCYNFLI